MKIDKDFGNALLRNLSKQLLRYYPIISFILAMAMIIYCVMTIQLIYTAPSDEDYRTAQEQKDTTNTTSAQGKKTIQKLDQLRTVDDKVIVDDPLRHISPFLW